MSRDLDDAPTRLFAPKPRATATVVTPHRTHAATRTTRVWRALALSLLACVSLVGLAYVAKRPRPSLDAPPPISAAEVPPAAAPEAVVSPPPEPLAAPSATDAAHLLASHDLRAARAAYHALAAAHPDRPVYDEIARRLRRTAEARCAHAQIEGRPCD